MKALKMKNPPHPGLSVWVDCLEPHGLSVTEGAKILGVSRSALSHLVNESAALSWDMAIRLAKAFGGTPEGWMRLTGEENQSEDVCGRCGECVRSVCVRWCRLIPQVGPLLVRFVWTGPLK